MGRNGSGKTTLLRLIAGVFRPTERDAGRHRPDRLAARARRRLPSRTSRAATTSTSARRSTASGSRRSTAASTRSSSSASSSASSTSRSGRTPPACTCGSGSRSRSTSTRTILLLDEVFAVGDEAFQRKCDRPDPRVQAAGQDDRVRLALGRGARADVRSRDPPQPGLRRVRRRRPARRSGATRSSSPARRIRPSGRRGCASGAAGEARVAGVQLEGLDGRAARCLLGGRHARAPHRPSRAARTIEPPVLAVELRDAVGRAARAIRAGPRRARLGRDGSHRGCASRSSACRSSRGASSSTWR